MLSMVKENVKDLPTVFAEVIDAQFGGDIDAYVDYLYDNSVFTDEAKASAATSEQIKNDPAVVLATSVLNKMKELREKAAPFPPGTPDWHGPQATPRPLRRSYPFLFSSSSLSHLSARMKF